MTKAKKNKGRPKKEPTDLVNYNEETIISLYKEGASDVEIKAKIEISNDLFYRLLDENKQFSETIKKGRQLSQAWWEEQGRVNLKESKFNHVLWYMNMKNRFRKDWNDKLDNNGNDEKPSFLKIEFV